MLGVRVLRRGEGEAVIGLSLFSGVGGFELASEIAGLDVGWRWQIEIDEACRRVLERHYPNADRRKP